jgi:hypothetical protein
MRHLFVMIQVEAGNPLPRLETGNYTPVATVAELAVLSRSACDIGPDREKKRRTIATATRRETADSRNPLRP